MTMIFTKKGQNRCDWPLSIIEKFALKRVLLINITVFQKLSATNADF